MQSAQWLRQRVAARQERARRDREHTELGALPEVQAMLQEQFSNHYRAWLDQKIPALGNRTPHKTVCDPDGGEAVEALITQIERDGRTMAPPMDRAIVRQLRQPLGPAGE